MTSEAPPREGREAPASESPSAPPSYPAWRLLVVLMALNTVAYLDRNILALAVPQIKADLGLSHVEISILLGFGFILFFVLLGIPFGWLVDRMSRRLLIFFGVTFWSFAASGAGLANGFWQLLAARIGVGAGEAVLNPASYSLIADTVPRRRLALALSLYGGSAGLGAAVSVGAGGVLLGLAAAHGDFDLPIVGTLRPWQFVLLLSGLPGLLLASSIFLVPEPARRDRLAAAHAPGQAPGLLRFMRGRALLMTAIFAGFSILQVMSYAFSTWQPTYMVERFGWDISTVGLVLSIGMLLSFFGAIAAGWIVDALVARGMADAPLRWATLVALASGLLIAIAFTVDNAVLCVVLVMIAQIPLSLIGICSTALQQVTPNEYRGRISAIFLLFGNLIGFGFGPLLPALITDHVFADGAMIGWSIAIVTAVAAPVTALLFRIGWKPMRVAVDDARRWISPDPPQPAG